MRHTHNRNVDGHAPTKPEQLKVRNIVTVRKAIYLTNIVKTSIPCRALIANDKNCTRQDFPVPKTQIRNVCHISHKGIYGCINQKIGELNMTFLDNDKTQNTGLSYSFHTLRFKPRAILCGSVNIFVGGRQRLSCRRSRKVYVLDAANTVSSRSSRYICGC